MWLELKFMILLDESWCCWHSLVIGAGSGKTYRVSCIDKPNVQISTGSRFAHLKSCCVHLEAVDCYSNPMWLMEDIHTYRDCQMEWPWSHECKLIHPRPKIKHPVTLVIMPLQVIISTWQRVPDCCSSEMMVFSKLLRWSSVVSSSFWNVSKPEERSEPRRGG